MQLHKRITGLPPLAVLALVTTTLATPGTAVGGERHAPIGEAIKSVPIFDAHVHYKQPAWGPFPPQTVIEMMDRNGVAMALVSSTPDAGTIRLWKFAPKRIIPELRPYHDSAGSSNWTKAEGMAAYLRERLAKYPHRGIGEFHIHSLDPADEPLLRDVTQMAVERKIPIHIHSGATAVDLLYRLAPSLTVIWAHAGMTEPARVVEAMMEKYATLHADTSYRERDILSGADTIDPDWRSVIVRFQDRFMVGSDTWVNSQWENYDALIALNRAWLSLFPRGIAEKIAFRNAERLFGRKIDRTLLGQR